MSFDLTAPGWLLTLLLLPALVFYFYWSLVDLPRVQRLVSLVVRGAICLLLSLALAGLTLLTPTDEVFVVFALDDSLSVDEESATKAREYIQQATETQRAGTYAVLPFARSAERFQSDWRAGSVSDPSLVDEE
jgi:hypothetical protein